MMVGSTSLDLDFKNKVRKSLQRVDSKASLGSGEIKGRINNTKKAQ